MNKLQNSERKTYILIRARLQHGWTQADLAEKVGVDSKTISRWEKGITAPFPLHRAKLRELLHIEPEELWPVDESKPALTEGVAQQPGSLFPFFFSSSALIDPALPSLPETTSALIGRGSLLTLLKECFCTVIPPVHLALYGLPGIGKTSLAIALAHDAALQERFSDGVLWATVGPRASILNILSRWGTLLGVSRPSSEEFGSEEAWARAIRDTIGMRRMLLIIDDPWDIHTALSFKVGGPCCAYLLTTRFPGLARRFTPKHAFNVPELTYEESTMLLSQLAPDATGRDSPRIQELLQSIGGLPLALTLIGKYLQVQASSGQPRHLHAALERVRLAEERLCLTEPQSLLEHQSCLPIQASLSLGAVIAASEQLLSEKTRSALATLSLFPAKPNSFAEEALLAFPHISVEEIDQLLHTGLLESHSPGRYMLHHIIADYARLTLHTQCAYSQKSYLPFVRYYTAFAEQYSHDVERLAMESANILTALEVAYTEQCYEELTRGVGAFSSFLLFEYKTGKDISRWRRDRGVSSDQKGNLKPPALGASSPNLVREYPNTYFISDSLYEEECTRLQIQDQMLISGMGGVLPEQPDPTIFRSALDVACGMGGWLIEAAKTYPTLSRLIGIDVDAQRIEYARARGEAQHVYDRIEFYVADALYMLEFPSECLDLVNMVFGVSYLRIWDWPKLLQEFLRVTRPGGVIRVIESDMVGRSSSPALNCVRHWLLQAFYQAGHLYTPDPNELGSELPRLLRQSGVQKVQTRACTVHYRAGTVEFESFYEDMRHVFRTMVPFLQKWGGVPEGYEMICQRALSEMLQPDFVATWGLFTVWGNKIPD